tara:strand:+ start:602 stop:2143 length:1542 start_codon:yes stop_codon:yes gene_type:complete
MANGNIEVQQPKDFWTSALEAYERESNRAREQKNIDRELNLKSQQVSNDSIRAEAVKQNADTQEWSNLATFWQGEIERARPDQRANLMRAANDEFEEKFPGQTNPYTQDIINNEVEYSNDYQKHKDVFVGTSGQNLDDVDKALIFFSQDPARNAHILSQLRSKKETLLKTESNRASLDLISGLITNYLPKNKDLADTISTIKGKDLITDSMLTNIIGVAKTAIDKQTENMKILASEGKLRKEYLKDYADSLREIGLAMMDTNPEDGNAYIETSTQISAGLPYLNIGASKAKDEPGLGLKTAAEIAEKYTTEQKGYISGFEKKIRDSVGEKSRINIDGKNISGKEFLKNLDDGRYSDDEILNATIMDKDLPTGRVLAANEFKNETVYDSAGNEYKISKMERGAPRAVIGAGIPLHWHSPYNIPINYITVTKDGKEVDSKMTIQEFNRKYSMEKPGVTFETKRKEEGVLSPDEGESMREEAIAYANSIGYNDDLSVDEKKSILNKVYDKYPQLRP